MKCFITDHAFKPASQEKKKNTDLISHLLRGSLVRNYKLSLYNVPNMHENAKSPRSLSLEHNCPVESHSRGAPAAHYHFLDTSDMRVCVHICCTEITLLVLFTLWDMNHLQVNDVKRSVFIFRD